VTTREKIESLLRRLCVVQEEETRAELAKGVPHPGGYYQTGRLADVFDATVHRLMALIGGR
jgi:hypothetical protein